MNMLKKIATLGIIGIMSLGMSISCFASTPQELDKSMKEEIMATKDQTPNEDKTERLFVKMGKNYDINEYINKVAAQYDFTTIKLVNAHGYIYGSMLYTIQCGSVKEADIAVELFNAYDEVDYAEPEDIYSDYDRWPAI